MPRPVRPAFPPAPDHPDPLPVSRGEFAAESLAISPDGGHLTVAYTDQLRNLMVAEDVSGIERPRRAAAE